MSTNLASISISASKQMPRTLQLFVDLIKRELETRYKNTHLGLLWFILHPLLVASSLIAIKVFFSHEFGIDKVSLIDFYLLLILWLFFVMSAQNSIDSLTRNPKFISNLKLPVCLVPLSVTVVSFIATLVNIVFYYFALFFLEKKLLPYFFELMSVIFVYFIFVSSFCIIFAFLQTFIPDLRLIFPHFVRLGLVWLPIFYDLSFIPENLRMFYKNIPFVWVILRTKEMFCSGTGYAISSSLNMILLSLLFFFLIVLTIQKLEQIASGMRTAN